MLVRTHRFHGYTSLQSVYRRGETVRGSMLSLKYAQRHPSRPYRAGVVIGRKVSKSAVVRNRIRRRIFEVLRQELDSKATGYDLVITGYDAELATIDHQKLLAMIQELLQKAHL